MAISFMTFDSELGSMAAVGEGNVLRQITFGYDTAAAAVAALDSDFLWRAEERIWDADLAERLRRFAAGSAEDFSDVLVDTSQMTAFQLKVIRHCRGIAWGQRLTYAELAAAVGSPGAARAVGNVMACNRFPLVVPCHRVVGGGGGLGGYSAAKGLAVKKQLLERECPGVSFRAIGKSGRSLVTC